MNKVARGKIHSPVKNGNRKKNGQWKI